MTDASRANNRLPCRRRCAPNLRNGQTFAQVSMKTPTLRVKARQPRHAKTAALIGRRIMGGDLEPGAILPNAALLAREFKLSRPSLREAMKILAAKGLLSAAPRRGTIVRPRSDWNRLDHDVLAWESEVAPTPRFIRDLFELRRMVEPEAAALAAQRATERGPERDCGGARGHDDVRRPVGAVDRGRSRVPPRDPHPFRQRFSRHLRAGDRGLVARHLRGATIRPAVERAFHPVASRDLSKPSAIMRRRWRATAPSRIFPPPRTTRSTPWMTPAEAV